MRSLSAACYGPNVRLKPPWLNGQGVRFLIRRLRVRVPLGVLAPRTATARRFEPLRAEPNGFLVHHLNHSVTLSRNCIRKNKFGTNANRQNILHNERTSRGSNPGHIDGGDVVYLRATDANTVAFPIVQMCTLERAAPRAIAQAGPTPMQNCSRYIFASCLRVKTIRSASLDKGN